MSMGNAAAERCYDFGWHPRGAIDPALVAETYEHSKFGGGHAWSRSAGYSLTTAPERTYLVLTVEGGFEFDVDGSTVPTEPGSLIMLDGAAPTTARTVTETSRYVWYLEPTFLQHGLGRFHHGEPIPMNGAGIQTLMGMTNALLTSPRSLGRRSRRYVTLAFEHLLAGVLEDAPTRPQVPGSHRDGLFMAAHSAIEAGFRDPGFSVTRLARELSVSERTLRDTFQRMGTTPRREIERRRVTEAGELAEAGSMSLSEQAALAGFTSAKQLTRALARTGMTMR
jgi:AraC-like DNA-binding protein